jgi:hypothetical protein
MRNTECISRSQLLLQYLMAMEAMAGDDNGAAGRLPEALEEDVTEQ